MRPYINSKQLLFRHTLLQTLALITRTSHFKKFYQIPNHSIVTCVQLNGENLFVASHTYVPGYTRGFVVYMVNKISYCRQAGNEL